MYEQVILTLLIYGIIYFYYLPQQSSDLIV